MTVVSSASFMLPRKERLKVVRWWLLDGGQASDAPDVVLHWDALTRLELSCDVEFDLDAIRSDCKLASDARFGLILRWQSPGTAVRGAGPLHTLGRAAKELTLSASVPGTDVAQSVKCDVHCLYLSGKSKSVVAPRVPGSILWTSTKELLLEGIGSRFPVEFCDFSQRGWLPDDAAWYLDWDPEQPDQPFLRGVRLLVNTRNRVVSEAVSGHGGTPSSLRQQTIVETVNHDVARVLIFGCLRSAEFLRGAAGDFSEGTVGRIVLRLLRLLFPGRSIAELAESAQASPFRLECELQEALALFAKESS
jgi:hypothetical protein